MCMCVCTFVCLSAAPDRMVETVVTLSIIAIIIGHKGYPKHACVFVCVCACACVRVDCVYLCAQTTISIAIKPITVKHGGGDPSLDNSAPSSSNALSSKLPHYILTQSACCT